MHKTDMSDEPRARSPSGWYSGMSNFGGRGGVGTCGVAPGVYPGKRFLRGPPMERVTNKLMGVTYRQSRSTPEKGHNKSAGISRLIKVAL